MKFLKAEEKRGCCPTLRIAQIGRFLCDGGAALRRQSSMNRRSGDPVLPAPVHCHPRRRIKLYGGPVPRLWFRWSSEGGCYSGSPCMFLLLDPALTKTRVLTRSIIVHSRRSLHHLHHPRSPLLRWHPTNNCHLLRLRSLHWIPDLGWSAQTQLPQILSPKPIS